MLTPRNPVANGLRRPIREQTVGVATTDPLMSYLHVASTSRSLVSRKVFVINELLHEGVEGMSREAFDVVEVPFYAFDENTPSPLYRPATCAIHALAIVSIARQQPV